MKVLGIDLGTDSLGWSIRNKDIEQGNQIEDAGVVIFPKGVGEEKNNEFSLAAYRTDKRQSRRKYYRRKMRKGRLLRILIQEKMCPLSIEALDKWTKHVKGEQKVYPKEKAFIDWLRINPYEARRDAASKKVDPFVAGRALYHIVQRRGFKSNRKDQSDEKELGKVKSAIAQLEKDMDGDFLGTHFHKVIAKEKIVFEKEKSVKNEEDHVEDKKAMPKAVKARGEYTARKMYIDEFEAITKKQQFSDDLTTLLHKEIFIHRPLKSQKHTVGKCTFEKKKHRAPISSLAYEEYRMLQFINNIKYKNLEEEQPEWQRLSKEQRDKATKRFYLKRKNFDFVDIVNHIIPKHKKKLYSFNFKYKQNVAGSICTAELIKFFDKIDKDKWSDFPELGEKGKISKHDIWHAIFSFNDKENLKQFGINHLELDEAEAERFSNITFPQGYANLSEKAINKILPFLREGFIYSHAAFLANIPTIIGAEKWESNKERITKSVGNLINNHRERNMMNRIINDSIHHFFESGFNAGNDYVLDDDDKHSIKQKIKNYFGEKGWKQKSKETKQAIKREIYSKLTEQLRLNVPKVVHRYLKIPRIDERIKNYLKQNYGASDEQLKLLYHPSDIEQFPKARKNKNGDLQLGSPATDSIKNPMAMRALYQLKHLVNYLISEGKINERDKVILETSRHLNSANERAAIDTYQRIREKENQEYRDEIIKECPKVNPTKEDVLKYRLWLEQKRICIYTGNSISVCDLFTENPKYDIEHTLPRSKSYDNSQANKTLCEKRFNQERKKQKLPVELPEYDEILQRIEHWKEKYEELNIQIERRSKVKGYEEPEQKKSRIQKKNLLILERNYWRDKYQRFTTKEITAGFKNSQLIDIGIITKYARAYLKSLFSRVYTVKGTTTDDVRKAFCLQKEDEKKDRTKHIHHTEDACVITFLEPELYNNLAKAYHEVDESYDIKKRKIKLPLPWDSFVQDIRSMQDEVLVYHHKQNHLGKHTYKKWRVNGKIQKRFEWKKDDDGKLKKSHLNLKDEKENTIYIQGDTARVPLHMESFYGNIMYKNKEDTDKEKWLELGKTGKGIFVKRKPLEFSDIGFKTEKQLQAIVDKNVRELVLHHVNQFKTEKGKVDLNEALSDKNPVWMKVKEGKEDKRTRIKKVRCYAGDVKNPIKVKKQRDQHSKIRKPYKEFYYAKNDGNVLIAIYKGLIKGKQKRGFELVNNFEASAYYKESNKEQRSQYPLVPESKDGLQLVQTLYKGNMILLYEKTPDEINWDDKKELSKRLYKVTGLSISLIKRGENEYKFGVVVLKHHMEARKTSDLKMLDGAFEIDDNKIFRKLSHNQINCLIANRDFYFNIDGSIDRIS